MPDDDKFTRDHGPGWTGATRALLRERPGDELPFAQDRDPDVSGERAPAASRLQPDAAAALCQALDKTRKQLGSPDLRAAADDLHAIARSLQEETLDPDELCTRPTTTGADALAGQAVRVLAATRRAEDLVAMAPDELAQELAVEFLRGVGRRYGIDRLAPFDFPEALLDPATAAAADALPEALGILSGFDMFMAGPLVRELAAGLLE